MTENEVGVILEEVREQYKNLQEGLDNLHDVPQRLDRLETDVSELVMNMRIVKEVVPQHSQAIRQHTDEIAHLKIK